MKISESYLKFVVGTGIMCISCKEYQQVQIAEVNLLLISVLVAAVVVVVVVVVVVAVVEKMIVVEVIVVVMEPLHPW